MKLSLEELQQLIDSGPDAALSTLRFLAAREAKDEDRRRKDAERKRTKRGLLADSERKSEDSPPSLLSPIPPINSPPSTTTDSKTNTRAGAGAKRLPAEWHPTEAHWLKARDEWGIDEETLRFETSAFRDHWHASGLPNARKLEWGAAWLNWIRKLKREQRQSRGQPPPQHNGLAEVRKQLAEVERREKNGKRDSDFKLEPEP